MRGNLTKLIFLSHLMSERRSKKYSESILDEVKGYVSGFTEYKYLGCRERVAREAYQLTVNGMTMMFFRV